MRINGYNSLLTAALASLAATTRVSMAKPSGAISMKLDSFVQGGLLDDVDATFSNTRLELKTLGAGKEGVYVCADLTVDGDDSVHEQFFRAGNAEHFGISEDDDKFIVATGEKGGLIKGTNWHRLWASLVKLGLSEAEYDKKGVACLDGLKAHLVRVPVPENERRGMVTDDGKKAADPLIATKIITFPGGKAGKATTTTKAAPKAKKVEEETEETGDGEVSELDAALREIVTKALAKGAVNKKKLVSPAYSGLDAKQRSAGSKRVVEDEFLIEGAGEGLWEFDIETGEVAPV